MKGWNFIFSPHSNRAYGREDEEGNGNRAGKPDLRSSTKNCMDDRWKNGFSSNLEHMQEPWMYYVFWLNAGSFVLLFCVDGSLSLPVQWETETKGERGTTTVAIHPDYFDEHFLQFIPTFLGRVNKQLPKGIYLLTLCVASTCSYRELTCCMIISF